MAKKFSIKKLTAGVLALLMVVTALPVSGITATTSKAAENETVNVYRSYNPNSGEHLLTVNKAEHDSVVSAGRSDEGVKWVAPVESDTPVYRSYNPNTGEHLLVPKEEAEWLATQGWNNEGIKMYSDDEKGVPVYRVYNPNAKDAGSHLYTASKEESDWLVAQGWIYDNDGAPVIYGADKNKVLELESVEDASGGVGNIVIAYFNKEIGDLTATDIQIRRVSDDQLFSVEKVVMSSDKKTATITLANTNAAGVNTSGSYLQPNIDYNLIVTYNGETAEKVFNIPDVAEDVVITAVNPLKGTITYGTLNATNGAITPGKTLYDTNELIEGYYELLGTTQTIKYNSDNEIVSLKGTDKNVIYGSFKSAKTTNLDGATITLTNVFDSEETYTTADNTTFAYTLGQNDVLVAFGAAVAVDTQYSLAKLILDRTGAVERIIYENSTLDKKYVASISGENITDVDKTETSLKDVVIVKDGMYFTTVEEIEEGDVIYKASDSDNVAYIFSTSITAPVSAVYTDRAVVAGKTLEYAKLDAAQTTLRMDNAAVGASFTDFATNGETYFNLMKTGGDVTIYLNPAGLPSYIFGITGQEALTNKDYVVKTAAFTYESPNKTTDSLYWVLGDGKENLVIDIPVAQLSKVTVGTTVAEGTASTPLGTSDAESNSTDITDGSSSPDLANAIPGSIVTVSTNSAGKIVALSYKGSTNKTDVTASSNGLDFSKNPNVMESKVISTTTPIFIFTWNTTASAVSDLKKTTVGEFNAKMKASVTTSAHAAYEHSYVYFDTTSAYAKYIVIENGDLDTASTSTVASAKTAIVSDIAFATNASTSVTELSYLDVIYSGESEATRIEASECDAIASTTTLADAEGTSTAGTLAGIEIGDIVRISFDASGKVVIGYVNGSTGILVDASDGGETIGTVSSNEVTSDGTKIKLNTGATDYEYNSTYSNLYKVDASSDSGFTKITWDEVKNNIDKIQAAYFVPYAAGTRVIGTMYFDFAATATAAQETSDLQAANAIMTAFVTAIAGSQTTQAIQAAKTAAGSGLVLAVGTVPGGETNGGYVAVATGAVTGHNSGVDYVKATVTSGTAAVTREFVVTQGADSETNLAYTVAFQ